MMLNMIPAMILQMNSNPVALFRALLPERQAAASWRSALDLLAGRQLHLAAATVAPGRETLALGQGPEQHMSPGPTA